MSLYPTPTRRRRLAEVARGEICRYGDGQDYAADGLKVTAGMQDLERAGWVVLGPPHPLKTPWLLTPAGIAVAAGGS